MAHPKCRAKLLQIYGTSFYGSNLWDPYSKEFMSLGKTWNVAIAKVYNVPFQTHCRFLQHVSQLNHVTHMLKRRLIKFMVANLVGKNNNVAYVANLCFRNAMSSSGRNINKIMSEYKLDYRLLQLPHVFNIKVNMDIMYKDTMSTQIHGEEWKINMILEIVDCLNGLCENDDENMFLLSDICIT